MPETASSREYDDETPEVINEDADFELDGSVEKVFVSTDTVKDYFRKIGKTPLLTAMEEVELSKTMEVGLLATERKELMLKSGADASSVEIKELKELERLGNRAKDRMTRANLRLVVSIASRYRDRGLDMPDLFQEGNLGLIRAIEQFDYKKGFKFSTYATWWIRQSLQRGLADTGRTVRLPIHLVEKLQSVRKTRADLLQDIGREPSDQEVADAMDIPLEKLEDYDRYVQLPASLNRIIGDNDDTEFGDLMPDEKFETPEASVEMLGLKDQLMTALNTLPGNEREVIIRRFGLGSEEPVALQDIAKDMRVTRETIRQIELRAMKKLRANPKLIELLLQYL